MYTSITVTKQPDSYLSEGFSRNILHVLAIYSYGLWRPPHYRPCFQVLLYTAKSDPRVRYPTTRATPQFPNTTSNLSQSSTKPLALWEATRATCSANWLTSGQYDSIVANLGISGKERNERWPCVFMKKYLHSDFERKGQAAKTFDSARNGWYYSVAHF